MDIEHNKRTINNTINHKLKTIKTVTEEIKVTCLHDRHVAQGALMSPFAGYDMPIQYVDITTEHNAVRHKVGVFDVSHMGEVEITGPDAAKFTNYIFTNDITAIKAGQILYGMMLYPNGGTVDDLLVYRVDDNDYFLVINAANIDKFLACSMIQATSLSMLAALITRKKSLSSTR